MSKYESASFEVERLIKNVDSYAKKDGHDTWIFRVDTMIKRKKIKTEMGKQHLIKELRKDIF